MASSRKKQDEQNVKTLRELGALPQNKYCFECNQRGPTYVDVTVGSFVCTKCSGMLRGLTPPHRVKSISMATFTTEEIDLIRNRGNEYCRRVWMGLYEGVAPPLDSNRDEEAIKDQMVDKYEKKRYYLDPAQALRNGYANGTAAPNGSAEAAAPKPKTLPASVMAEARAIVRVANMNGNATEFNRKRPEVANKNNNSLACSFAVNFDNADIFSSVQNNSTTTTQQQQHVNNQRNQQVPFANFDDNPVFQSNSALNGNSTTDTDEFSIFDLQFTNSGPVLNEVPLFPKCNTNRWSMPIPTPSAFDGMSFTNNSNRNVTSAPFEDKYAALKDLDNALKSQNNGCVDWNPSSSNGSIYNSSTPGSSMYSTPSPQSTMFGSPSQGHLFNAFQTPHEANNVVSNPFNTNTTTPTSLVQGSFWDNSGNNGLSNNWHSFANPFRDPVKPKQFAQSFQPAVFPTATTNGSAWGHNPFKMGTTADMNSNNPFL